MERTLSWLRNHVTDGEKWCKVMYEALPREDEMTEEDKVKMAKEAAPAPAAAAATLEALEEMVDEMDAARKKPAAEALTADEIDFVEGGKMNLAEFTAWMKLVTASFEKETYDMVIRQLIAYLTKEQQATRLFKAWDDDNSGELETVELRKILDIFKEQFDIDGAAAWPAAAAASAAPRAARRVPRAAIHRLLSPPQRPSAPTRTTALPCALLPSLACPCLAPDTHAVWRRGASPLFLPPVGSCAASSYRRVHRQGVPSDGGDEDAKGRRERAGGQEGDKLRGVDEQCDCLAGQHGGDQGSQPSGLQGPPSHLRLLTSLAASPRTSYM